MVLGAQQAQAALRRVYLAAPGRASLVWGALDQGRQSGGESLLGNGAYIETPQNVGDAGAKAQVTAMLKGAQETLGQIVAQDEAPYGGSFQVVADVGRVQRASLPLAFQPEGEHAVHFLLQDEQEFAAAGEESQEPVRIQPRYCLLPERRVRTGAFLLIFCFFARGNLPDNDRVIADRQAKQTKAFDHIVGFVALAQGSKVFLRWRQVGLRRPLNIHSKRLLVSAGRMTVGENLLDVV